MHTRACQSIRNIRAVKRVLAVQQRAVQRAHDDGHRGGQHLGARLLSGAGRRDQVEDAALQESQGAVVY